MNMNAYFIPNNRTALFNGGLVSTSTKNTPIVEGNQKIRYGNSVTISNKAVEQGRINHLNKMKHEKLKQKAEVVNSPLGQNEAEAEAKLARLEMLEVEIATLEAEIAKDSSGQNGKYLEANLTKKKDPLNNNPKEEEKEKKEEMAQMTNILKGSAKKEELKVAVSAREKIQREIVQLQIEMDQDKSLGLERIVTVGTIEEDGKKERKAVETTRIGSGAQASMERKAEKLVELQEILSEMNLKSKKTRIKIIIK